MDWGKAKNIFIISFLMLNIILGYQLYIKYNSYNQIWTTDNNEELKRVLTRYNILLEIDLPKESPEIDFVKVNNKLLANENSINLNNDENITRDKLEKVMGEEINNFYEYEYIAFESNNKNHFVYNQINSGYQFFDAKIVADIDVKGNINYRQNYFEVIDIGLKKQVISSSSALKIAIEQQLIPSNSSIEKIILGYRGQLIQSSIQDLTPAWGIVYKLNNDVFITYINALTGGIELDF